jgi:hypothetical protein
MAWRHQRGGGGDEMKMQSAKMYVGGNDIANNRGAHQRKLAVEKRNGSARGRISNVSNQQWLSNLASAYLRRNTIKYRNRRRRSHQPAESWRPAQLAESWRMAAGA